MKTVIRDLMLVGMIVFLSGCAGIAERGINRYLEHKSTTELSTIVNKCQVKKECHK